MDDHWFDFNRKSEMQNRSVYFLDKNEIMLKNKSYLLRFDFNPRDISKGFFISNVTKNSRWTYSQNLFKKHLHVI
jgi:hypothetical protein